MTDVKPGHLPTGPLDPVAGQVAAFFAQDPAWQAIRTAPLAQTREAFRAATPASGEPAMEEVTDIQLAVENGEIALRHFRPCARPSAKFVWLHGGGFALGSNDESDNFARQLAARTGCSVITVEYRLAPEHKFPTAVHDAMAAILWVDANISSLAGSTLPLIVGGDSAGGNLATVATRKLHADGKTFAAANILAYPSTDVPDAPSLSRFDAPFLTRSDVRFFHEQYLPGEEAGRDPDFAPILADNLSCLPPTLIITAEHDIVTEQAEDYGRTLADAGVRASVRQYPAMIHGFLTADVFLPGAAGEAIDEIGRFISVVCGKVKPATQE